MADLSPEEFAALRAQGLSVQQIARMDPDSVRASSQPSGPQQSSFVERATPYAVGAGAAALGVGGVVAGARKLRGAMRGRVGGAVGRELMRDRGPIGAFSRVASAAMTPAPAASTAPPQTATRAGQATFPDPHKQAMAEAKVREANARADAAELRRDALKAKTGSAESRISEPQKPAAERPSAPKSSGGPKSAQPVREGNIIRMPPGTEGATRPELGARQLQMIEAARRTGGDEAAARMAQRLAQANIESAARPRGRMAGVGRAAGGVARVAGDPYLGLLFTLLNAGEIPEQMDEAAGIYREATRSGMRPSARRQFVDDQPDIY